MTTLMTAPYAIAPFGSRLCALHATPSAHRHPAPQGGLSTPLTKWDEDPTMSSWGTGGGCTLPLTSSFYSWGKSFNEVGELVYRVNLRPRFARMRRALLIVSM